MEKLIIVTGGALFVGFIVWWFFGKHKTTEAEASVLDGNNQEVTVTVDGAYTPNTVVLKQGVPANIVFERKDPSGCFNEVVFPDFGIHETLPIGEKHPIKIDTTNAGEYQYACGMNMFFGKVVIKQ